MKKIYIVYDQTSYTFAWLSTLLWCKKEFREAGYLIKFPRFFYGLSKANKLNTISDFSQQISRIKNQIIFFAFHHTTKVAKDDKSIIELLVLAKRNGNRVIWLDTSDSGGLCKFGYMPYVDRYLKKQIYKDLSVYKREVWGGRLFCEYYHNKLKVEDSFVENDKQTILLDQYKDKLGISWNVGLGNCLQGKYSRYLNTRRLGFLKCFTSPSSNRYFDVHYRGSGKSPIAGYQRSQLASILQNEKDFVKPDCSKIVSYKNYKREIENSKAVLSPFGWGEVCSRDFEALWAGALLIKPSMSHLITYPDFYQDGVTYVPISWDLDDAVPTLKKIQINYNSYLHIAIAGQAMLKRFYSKQGKMEFVQHLLNEI